MQVHTRMGSSHASERETLPKPFTVVAVACLLALLLLLLPPCSWSGCCRETGTTGMKDGCDGLAEDGFDPPSDTIRDGPGPSPSASRS